MFNDDILRSIFKNYGINKVLIKEEQDTITFIISDMSQNISLNRWNYLEAILNDITKKDIVISTYNQILKDLGENYTQESRELL